MSASNNRAGARGRFFFDWDVRKAERNLLKHGTSFDDAGDVFLDPLAVTLLDEDNGEQEDR